MLSGAALLSFPAIPAQQASACIPEIPTLAPFEANGYLLKNINSFTEGINVGKIIFSD